MSFISSFLINVLLFQSFFRKEFEGEWNVYAVDSDLANYSVYISRNVSNNLFTASIWHNDIKSSKYDSKIFSKADYSIYESYDYSSLRLNKEKPLKESFQAEYHFTINDNQVALSSTTFDIQTHYSYKLQMKELKSSSGKYIPSNIQQKDTHIADFLYNVSPNKEVNIQFDVKKYHFSITGNLNDELLLTVNTEKGSSEEYRISRSNNFKSSKRQVNIDLKLLTLLFITVIFIQIIFISKRNSKQKTPILIDKPKAPSKEEENDGTKEEENDGTKEEENDGTNKEENIGTNKEENGQDNENSKADKNNSNEEKVKQE